MRPVARSLSRSFAATLAAIAASLCIVPALADKPPAAPDRAVAVKITAIAIDFDREHPDQKQFGKLIYRGGLNLFANSSFFGGYSEMVLDPTGTTLLAVSDAGTWLRATLDYDGRELKGLSNAMIGPLLGKDGKPLVDDQERNSEGMTLIDGTPSEGHRLCLI